MQYRINHVHIKSETPKETADWYVRAFGFEIVTDEVRHLGDRFIRCKAANPDLLVMISGPRTGETLAPAGGDPCLGLEHIGFESTDLDADLAHLQDCGAELVEGPMDMPGGVRVAFLKVPGQVRVELIQRPPG